MQTAAVDRAGENIFLFVPNIIGYIRIFLVLMSCYWMYTDPLKAALCFSLAHTILDDLDGMAARRFKQATRFGGVFDIVIDRCSFMVWLMGLCNLYPQYQYTLAFQLFGFLDIMRMWMKVYSGALSDAKNHKSVEDSKILQFYYSELGLHVFSYGSELYFVMLHLCYFSPGPIVPIVGYGIWQVLAGLLFPLVIVKIPINILILVSGCKAISEVDARERNKK